MSDQSHEEPAFLSLPKRELNRTRIFGETIFSEKIDDFEVQIGQRSGTTLTTEEINKLRTSGFEAIKLARKISPNSDNLVRIICDNTFKMGYAHAGFTVGRALIDDEAQSQVGGILHELIESLQAEESVFLDHNSEVLPQIAEFLFTGESRVKSLFKIMSKRYFQGKVDYLHTKAWGSVIKNILGTEVSERDNPEEIFNLLLDKRKLSKDEKIEIIKVSLKRALQEGTTN